MSGAKLQLIRTAFGKLWRAKAGESRQQVAAVCYRLRKRKLEFLLVRTRKGRWTFPKGGVINGLTHAQSAALEAFEEAGVHGRIEESAFAKYTLRKRKALSEASTQAHLCEVLRLEEPEEPNRTPTWFSPERTQLCLQERRSAADGRELARVVERAVNRIQRSKTDSPGRTEPLQRVQFEASGNSSLVARSALVAYIREGRRTTRRAPLLEFDPNSRKVVRIESPSTSND